MKYFSLFSGIGGFENGIDGAIRQLQQKMEQQDNSQNDKNQRGFGDSRATCTGYSEINPYAIKVYERQFSGHKNYGDITRINTADLPDFDLHVGGFPCQAFSIAGKRGGFDDTRGTLFFEVARILRDKRPRYFVLENVKGLLSHDSGKTFQTILRVLAEAGYGVSWSIHNTKDYGLPQNRERIYIVGCLGEPSGREIFPIRQNDQAHIAEKRGRTKNQTCISNNYS